MSYQQKASRVNPCLIVFLLDDSGSMADTLTGTNDTRFKWVELYFGHILFELLKRSTEMAGDAQRIKPRYYVYVVMYGSSLRIWGSGLMDIETAVKLFSDTGQGLGLGGYLGGTDAEMGFSAIEPILQQAITDPKFAQSFPPMVFHLTDGESSTDAGPIAERIRQLSTGDGQALVLNAYIGTQTELNYQGPEDFPGYKSPVDVGSSHDNLRLFEMSSVIPDTIQQNLIAEGVFPSLQPSARLFFDVRTKDMLKNVIQVVGSLGSRAAR